jgi:hypothetical protein
MLLRIGVEDGNEVTARTALAMSARGCRAMFQEWLNLWTGGAPRATPGVAAPGTTAAAKRTLKLSRAKVPVQAK